MLEKIEFIEEYSKAIKEGYAAVFAGAGLSASSGYVNWKELVKPLAEQLMLNIEKESSDLIAISQYFQNVRGNRTYITQKLLKEFTKNSRENNNMNLLSTLPIKTYWTTNYDKIIENTLINNNKKVDTKFNQSSLSLHVQDRDAVVYKMHGCISDPTNVILTKDDYETYSHKRQLFKTLLQADLISKTFLFIGFSFEDPNLQSILARIKGLLEESTRDHYCFFKKEKDEYSSIKQTYIIEDLKRYGIRVVLFDEYEDMTSLLENLNKIYKLNNVFISGSLDDIDNIVTSDEENNNSWNDSKIKNLINTIIKRLYNDNFKIISGYGKNIGDIVINTSIEEINRNKFSKIDGNLSVLPFPQTIADEQERMKTYNKYRNLLLGNSGVIVFLFGNKKENGEIIDSPGVWNEFIIAKKNKSIIIPIGSTGYMSRKIFHEVKSSLNNFLYLKPYLDVLENEMDIEVITETIINIINDEKRNVLQEVAI